MTFLILAELGRKHNKVTNMLISAIEKVAERADSSQMSQLKIVQPNLAMVFPNSSLSTGLVGLGCNKNQDIFTEDDILTIYNKEDEHSSFDTLLFLPEEQPSFAPDYKKRTYFITYRTNTLFVTDNQTMGNLSSLVIAAGVRGAQIQNLTQPVVIKFKPNAPVSGSITCVSWNRYLDENRGGWSNDGCSFKGRDNDFIICHCRSVGFCILKLTVLLLKVDHVMLLLLILLLSIMRCRNSKSSGD